MTREELNAALAETAETLRGLGLPVSHQIEPEVRVNSRAKRRLGCCYFQNGRYAVEISAMLLAQPEKLRQTLIHELLHTCPGCRNHGERWKAYAKKAGEALGCSIQRLAPVEGESGPLRRDPIKYVLECQSCGAKIYRSRLSKAVKQPWRYRCKCGGKLKRSVIGG
ncbi:SprT-like domain-containing protein [Neglectibacter caecimuris]|uniref:SprT-like domain-containing protein n=1 Tax=Neglectibacter caecimuris TaxID=3093658 RepID=UPI002AC95E05|nr:SprT-like domain-containing protein [Neglectibacter sp. M00184]